MLIRSKVLDERLNDLSALKSHLDKCRADHVRVRVVDCSGCLVYKTDMMYSGPSGVSSVGRLRSELTAHFKQVEAPYHDKVQQAIKRIVYQHEDRLPRRPELGMFLGRDGCAFKSEARWEYDVARFPLDGVTFRMAEHEQEPKFPFGTGEFFMSENWRSDSPNPRLRRLNGSDPVKGTPSVRLLLRSSFRSDRGFSGVLKSALDLSNMNVLQLKRIVARRDDSLELELGSEFFEECWDYHDNYGRPTFSSLEVVVATFSSLEVKKRFVELVDLLLLAREKENLPDYVSAACEKENHFYFHPEYNKRVVRAFGFRIGSIVMRFMHKTEILRRLDEPHRTNFDNNDWWYLTRNLNKPVLKPSLMAAESADESQNKILSDADSLADLIGAPEALPDEQGDDERLIQLRITTSQGAMRDSH